MSQRSSLDVMMDDMRRILALPPATQIHTNHCSHCPSAYYIGKGVPEDDLEMLEILEADRQTQLESLFRCAWREDKLCKGYCDILNITQKDVDNR